MSQVSVSHRLATGKQFLKNSGIGSYALDAQLLLMEATGLTKAQIFTDRDTVLTAEQAVAYERFLSERATQKPVQYIIKRCEFMSLPFEVNENVLIPRPDTETLVEEAVACVNHEKIKSVLEIGTGSGCIAVSIAHNCPQCHVTAVDLSEAALATAQKNAARNNVLNRVTFVQSDVFEQITKPQGGFGLVVSNPPYIPTAVVGKLEDNVKQFEPHLALCGGADGLRFYRMITAGCKAFMSEQATLMFEIGHDQAEAVSALLHENGFKNVNILKDLAGHNRVVTGFFSQF